MTDILQDAVAVVTGAGKGIGRRIAVAFARAGATVALAGRDVLALEETQTLIGGLGGNALVTPGGVGAPEQVDAMAAHVLDELGRVDVLVCNSGVAGPTAPLWEISLEDWEETMR